MIGIGKIGYALGENAIDNFERASALGVSEKLIKEKIGIERIFRITPDQDTSDLALRAIESLYVNEELNIEDVECLIVVTQNPDGFGLPHTSAILHNKLGLKKSTACFDISLGCSGYVYGLSVIKSFMDANKMTSGILVTADPYSKIINDNDINTSLIFGDAATATLISDQYTWEIGRFDFGTSGDLCDVLKVSNKHELVMNGRAVFDFSAKEVPISIQNSLELNKLKIEDIDQIILHQGSRFIVETIAKRLKDCGRIKFYASSYGNTISSSIPIILAENISSDQQVIMLSGFGVGLSWATTVIYR